MASLSDQISAQGAVKLREAATARGLHPDTLYEWARRGTGKSPFRGPRRILIVRESELDAELEHFRCSWDGCPEYALLSESGKCKVHDAAVPRQGKLTAQEFADRHEVNLPALVVRLEAGEIPGEKADRKGRPGGWLLDEEETLAALGSFRCHWRDGCPNYALGESRHCPDHAGAAASIKRAKPLVKKECAGCGRVRETFPSQQREGELCHECNLESEEFDRKRREAVAETWRARNAARDAKRDEALPWPEIAPAIRLSPAGSHGLRLEALEQIATERIRVGDFELVLYRKDSVARCLSARADAYLERYGSTRQHGRFASAIAAAEGKTVGRRRELASDEEGRIRELAAQGKSQRQVAYITGLSKSQIQRFLADQEVVRNPL